MATPITPTIGERVSIVYRYSGEHEPGTVSKVGIIRDRGGYHEHERFEVTSERDEIHSFHAGDWSAPATDARRPRIAD